MTRQEFLLKTRNRLRAKFSTYAEAAEYLKISGSHLSNVLRDKAAIPDSVFEYMEYKCVEKQTFVKVEK